MVSCHNAIGNIARMEQTFPGQLVRMKKYIQILTLLILNDSLILMDL